MNATGYIIEPSWFYWITVVENLRGALGFVGILLTIVLSISVATISLWDNKSVFKWMKVGAVVLLISVIGIIFIPSKETLITMMVAKYATYENVGLTVDALKGAVDYIIQSIQSLK